MVTKNNHLSSLIDHWLLDRGSCRHHRSGRRSRRRWGSAARRLLLIRNGLLLFAHRKIECQHERKDCESDHHKRAKGLSVVSQNTSAFYTRYWKHANR